MFLSHSPNSSSRKKLFLRARHTGFVHRSASASEGVQGWVQTFTSHTHFYISPYVYIHVYMLGSYFRLIGAAVSFPQLPDSVEEKSTTASFPLSSSILYHASYESLVRGRCVCPSGASSTWPIAGVGIHIYERCTCKYIRGKRWWICTCLKHRGSTWLNCKINLQVARDSCELNNLSELTDKVTLTILELADSVYICTPFLYIYRNDVDTWTCDIMCICV